MNTARVPLCVDLDGTLNRSDLLLESFLAVVKQSPLALWHMFLWLLRGKAVLKAELAQRAVIDVTMLPYDERFLAWLREERAAGREIWLCTASNYRFAEAVAAYLGIFDGVIASTDAQNLSGRSKAQELRRRFGHQAFDYCGFEMVELNVCESSRTDVVVNAAAPVEHRARTMANSCYEFAPQSLHLRDFVNGLRLHQWAKNALVFVPLFAAHKFGTPREILPVLLAFLAFGLCASSVYVVNDMLDLEADRQHPRKRSRPFASGQVALSYGFLMAPSLLLAAAALAWTLPINFQIVLGAYFVLTLAYSFGLKRLVLVDAIALAGLYTSRIVAGAAAVDVPLSFWLLLFSVFLFLSLALVKRFAELEEMRQLDRLRASGRGYNVKDLPILQNFGIASGYVGVLVLALYIDSPEVEVLYRRPEAIWLLCVLLLYWISRVWIMAHRGQMHDDPVVFALKDRVSLLVGAAGALTILLAI